VVRVTIPVNSGVIRARGSGASAREQISLNRCGIS